MSTEVYVRASDGEPGSGRMDATPSGGHLVAQAVIPQRDGRDRIGGCHPRLAAASAKQRSKQRSKRSKRRSTRKTIKSKRPSRSYTRRYTTRRTVRKVIRRKSPKRSR